MLTKAESAELLFRLNAYAGAVLVLIAHVADDERPPKLVLEVADKLDSVLAYVKEIS